MIDEWTDAEMRKLLKVNVKEYGVRGFARMYGDLNPSVVSRALRGGPLNPCLVAAMRFRKEVRYVRVPSHEEPKP